VEAPVARAVLLVTGALIAPLVVPRGAPRRLPGRPTLPLIRVDVARDHVLVTEDARLPRGDWKGGDVDLYVAFGAPGTPRAFDARLYPWRDAEPLSDEPFETLAVERSYVRPAGASVLLGPPAMAGVVIHLRGAAFARATAGGDAVRVRMRTVLDPPTPDAESRSEILVRLGAYEGEPDALGEVAVAAEAPLHLEGAEVRLCGPLAETRRLAIESPGIDAGDTSAIEPVLSVRHASDDLCVRFWPRPTASRAR
jgi:hypothetical protein